MFHQLYHITDVGSASGNGVDSTLRITQQYARLGTDVHVVSAGHSPLHVAFSACTDFVDQARLTANTVARNLGLDTVTMPIALNSAPRNSSVEQKDAREDYMYRVAYPDGQVFVLYGKVVLAWVLDFYGRETAQIQEISAIDPYIPDTSCGSQFRSGEHLPVAHVLEFHGKLLEHAKAKDIDASSISSVYLNKNDEGIVLPPDEYDNSRILLSRTLAERILHDKNITIADRQFAIAQSLTEVIPGELALWPSSNYFPNKELVVLNMGTRWSVGTTATTDEKALEIARNFKKQIGDALAIG